MANYNEKKPSTPADKMFLAIIIFIIAVVLGLAVFATYGKISANIEEKAIAAESEAIQNGSQEPTVRYLASVSGKTTDEYLEQYGLKLGGDLKATSTQTEMADKMSVENYYKYTEESAEEKTDIDELLTEWGAADLGITKDTTWEEAKTKLPIGKYLGGEDDYKQFVESYKSAGYDVTSITEDMPVSEAETKIEEILSVAPAATAAADTAETPAADATAAPEATAAAK